MLCKCREVQIHRCTPSLSLEVTLPSSTLSPPPREGAPPAIGLWRVSGLPGRTGPCALKTMYVESTGAFPLHVGVQGACDLLLASATTPLCRLSPGDEEGF